MWLEDASADYPDLWRNRTTGCSMNGMTTAQEYREKEAREADERHRPVIDAYREVRSQAEVARQFGVTRSRVQAILRRARERGLLDDDEP